jgi:hypothetical protein
LKVYEIEKEELCLRFAAGNIAEGEWGFYMPGRPGDPEVLTAREPDYEGYWRVSADQVSVLPWPVPDPAWTGRLAFLGILEDVRIWKNRL